MPHVKGYAQRVKQHSAAPNMGFHVGWKFCRVR